MFLTPKGLELAEFTSKKHHVIQQFFTKILKVELSVADNDVCAIEHVNDSVIAMQAFLQTNM